MHIWITLDYEIFFGAQSGVPENCMIEPTNRLLDIVTPYGIKLNLFVDAGYLIKLKEQKETHPQLEEDWQKVTAQIRELAQNGHGIELHIHPHWEDSFFDGQKWKFNTERYKLADFSKPEVLEIVTKYTEVLKEVSNQKPVAFRAGGWSIQPFAHIKEALKQNGVLMDSTVFPKGRHHSENQYYDYSEVEDYTTYYRFSDKITEKNEAGQFEEYPISSIKVNPLFFWRFAFVKIMNSPKHRAFGKGEAIQKPKNEILRMLFTPSHSVVSMDGFKASYLRKSFKKYQKNCSESANFVIIGHPKAFSPYSLKKMKDFIKENHHQHPFKTFR